MKTEVILSRSFLGGNVRQKSKTGMFSATDLQKIANIKRTELGLSIFNLSQFLKQKSTLEFIEELQKENERVIIKGRGRNSSTWVHPLLFIDIAMAIDSKLKIEVYKWLYDELIKYRNDSGDSYKEMSAAIWQRFQNKREFPKYITRVANHIRKSCGVDKWENATEKQLRQRDKIHYSIKTLTNVLTNTDEAVRLGVQENIPNSISK